MRPSRGEDIEYLLRSSGRPKPEKLRRRVACRASTTVGKSGPAHSFTVSICRPSCGLGGYVCGSKGNSLASATITHPAD